MLMGVCVSVNVHGVGRWQRGFESPPLRFALGHTWLSPREESFGDTFLPSATLSPSHGPQGWTGSRTHGGVPGRGEGLSSNTGGAELTSRRTLGRRLELFLIS